MENITKDIKGTIPAPLVKYQDPEHVLEFAQRAATALTKIISRRPNKLMIRGQQYLDFEAWQTLGRFFGISAGIEWVRPAYNENKAFGFESRAIVRQAGDIISSAEASCFSDEPNWKGKPTFQLKSMSQTRACAKALRTTLAWVVVLGGYSPTPAEEMIENQPRGSREAEPEIDTYESKQITDRQKMLLKSLILEKVYNEEERESRLAGIGQLMKYEASDQISELIAA